MEAMEVDLPAVAQPLAAAAAAAAPGASHSNAPPAVSDSGSSTEVEEDEDGHGGQTEADRVPPRPPPTWAFSQRAVGGAAAANVAGPDGPIRRRIRQGLRVHYPSQTAAPSRGFPDFLLRAPAASVAQPESGSTTEGSDSEDEDAGGTVDEGPPAAAAHPPSPASARLSDSAQQETGPSVVDRAEASNPADQPHAEVSKSSSTPQGEEGEGDTCTICFEPWTTAGQHRLSALRCGHLFGFTCIQRWLKAQGGAAKCPQCNKKAKRSDVVLLYAPRVKALDNSEQESLKRSLETEQTLRMKAELESAEYKQKLQVVTCKYGQVQKELQKLRAQLAHWNSLPSSSSPSSGSSSSSLASSATSSIHLASSQQADGFKNAQYQFSKGLLVSVNGGSRVLSYCEPLSCLLASQPSPQPTLIPGWGVKKVSVVNVKASQYVPIHSKQIRSLSFNQQNDSLMLSAALDGTIKLTSLLTNTVVQTYNTDKPVWSCCWCLDNSNYVYAGLVNGSVLLYDTRDTSTHVQELKPLRSSYPVVSLCYVPRAASSSFPCGGLIAGSLDGGCFWEHMDEGAPYRPHLLPRETANCIDIKVEAESRHCLVTYRPGRTNPNLRCALMALTRTPQQDSGQPPSCSCSPVQTFSAGSSCKLLTKSAILRSPGGDGTLVCTGDEASNSTWVWDAGSGSVFQRLPSDTPVLDISPFSVNGEHFLASLTEKMLKLYRWGPAGADGQ